jgi:hypothetical protein
MTEFVANKIEKLNSFGSPLTVSLSNELVNLLSDQLYQSPLKAIEELVVNSYDANATKCKVFVPSPSSQENRIVVVYDDGIGMDYEGLISLWQIGRSKKREDEIQKRLKRKQIGKFGIGKLAAKTIAHKLTYITKNQSNILTVSIDFRDFKDTISGEIKKVETKVYQIDELSKFIIDANLQKTLDLCGINKSEISPNGKENWTIALLEDLTEKSIKLRQESLRWVLRTAMPLRSDFKVFLNGEEVVSSKQEYDVLVDFELKELSKERLQSISKATGEEWKVVKDALVSLSFPTGVKGTVIVTKPLLTGGKSDDLIRSHGFFVRVRDRLVNDVDPLFGLTPLYFGTFSRFRADIYSDDLDVDLKASRETIEETSLKVNFRLLLREIFNEANTKYEKKIAELDKVDSKKEGERNQVRSKLVEFPVADVLAANVDKLNGAEADESWFYVQFNPDIDLAKLTQSLYSAPRRKYKYEYVSNGRTGRLVKFDPVESVFWINQDHEFVAEYINDVHARSLLQDLLTTEALLEIYLRLNQVPLNSVGKILEQRDELFRSLAQDRSYSLDTIARRFRDSSADEYELEISLVVAARALGFIATHIAGAGRPDGLAQFYDYPDGEKKITLEAKSSAGTPSLGAIDFAGLMEHMSDENAMGCLLVAPSYPASGKEGSAVADRAIAGKISCWTVEQIAKFVESAESRHLHARHVLEIVLTSFSPEDVKKKVDEYLSEPQWDQSDLYTSILIALKQLEGRLSDSPRTIDMIAVEVSRGKLSNIGRKEVERAINDLQGASKGGLLVRNESVILQVSISELERRLSNLIKKSTEPRRLSSFRKDE